MYTESKSSDGALILGLIILFITVLIALTSNLNLEEALTARQRSFESQDKFDDLNKKIKDFAFLGSLAEKNHSNNEKLSNIESEIETIFSVIQQNTHHDPSHIVFMKNTRDAWEHIRAKRGVVESSDLTLIDQSLKEMDRIESTKISAHTSTIIENSKQLTTFASITALVAFILIVFSMYTKHRRDLDRARVIIELNRLREAAVSASNMKSKFLSTVSHEIRTPLNGIIGLSDILLHTPPSNNQKMLVKTIHQSGKILLRIINDILDFSKIESGKFGLENSDFSIVDVLDQVMFTLSPKAAEKSISLNYEIDSNLPLSVRGDSGRLSQVLFNIIGNAIKFTSIGSIILRIQMKNSDSTTANIIFSIEDTGVGISAEELKHLFIPFVQGKKAGTSGEAGTGLGLSISKQIVNAMGGTLQVRSELGCGSKFWFCLPFPVHSKEKMGELKQFQISNKVDLELKIDSIFDESFRPKILIVEDNPTNQIVAQTMLEKFGANSIIAANGKEAIELISKSKFDLIFMDCQMPIMDGFEATKILRNEKVQTPIVAMTANASNEDEAKCLAAGMDDFLTKPISLITLSEKLKKHLPRPPKPSIRTLNGLKTSIGKAGTKKVLDAYLSTMPEFYSSLIQLSEQNNLEGLKRLGHRYSSSSFTVGALHFANLCKQLEDTEDINAANLLKDDLLQALQGAEESLRSFVKEIN